MRFHILTFGCRVNAAESDQLALKLLALGLKHVSISEAELVIINSCAITAKAVREVRQLLNQLKEQNPGVLVYVTGCAATLWEKNHELIKGADYLVNNLNKETLPNLIQEKFSLKPEVVFNLKPLGKFLKSSRLMVKVQDGCDYFCTYCIVPYLRGRSKGADPQQVLQYIKTLSEQLPINEVILSGINLGLYLEFNQLIRLLLKQTKLPKISFGSLYMENINAEFLDFYNSPFSDRLTRYFHIPLQSGSPKILSLMRRRYTLEEYTAKLATLSQTVPDALLATDIIVGFLDETATDFAATYAYLENSPLVRAHIFKYSQREFTAGTLMAKYHFEPTPEEKAERSAALHQLFAKKLGRFQEALLGQRRRALILRPLPEGYLGLLDNGLEVIIPNKEKLVNSFVNVEIQLIKLTKLLAKKV